MYKAYLSMDNKMFGVIQIITNFNFLTHYCLVIIFTIDPIQYQYKVHC